MMHLDLRYIVQSDGRLLPLPPSSEVGFIELLQRDLDDALQHQVFVLFSGGVDSSLLLSLVAQRAQETGRTPPIAITYRFPGAIGGSDPVMQDAVMQQLRPYVGDWVIVERDDADVAGPLAARFIEEFGLPPFATLHLHLPTFEAIGASSGSVVLLTGDGGDELFGRARAAAAGAFLRSARRGFQPAGPLGELRRAARTALPPRPPDDPRFLRPWLSQAAAEEVRARDLLPIRRAPWRRRHAIARNARRGWVVDAQQMLANVARQRGVDYRQPFLNPAAIVALTETVPARAFSDRATVVDWLYPGLLPPAVAGRQDKARFDEVFFTQRAHRFATSWSCDTLDDRYLLPLTLQQTWLSSAPRGPSIHMLQAAWASAEGLLR